MNEEIAREIILARIQTQTPNESILLTDIYEEMINRNDVHNPHMPDIAKAAEKLQQEGYLKLFEMIPPYGRARILPPI
jgi:hypothetical protein